ncbi:pilus assembly protein TadG-related protein [Streptomyces sp. NPDC054887]
MRSTLRRDRGQTLPMYVVVVGGLLFLAFAYFAFAQAAVARNGAQSAADAAALAAAQDARDELTDGFIDALGTPEWPKWLMAEGDFGVGFTAAARRLASDNDSNLVSVEPRVVNGYPAFQAEILTRFTVGDSVIPGTESRHAEADATAVIEPRCDIVPGGDLSDLVEIDCEGSGRWTIDPKDFVIGDLPQPRDLFSVHLAE